MKTVHLRPIKDLQGVAIGIAEFELRLMEYAELGGTLQEKQENKTDLLNIIPAALRDNLFWRATDPWRYAQFPDMVRSQTGRRLLQQKRLPRHLAELPSADSQPLPDETLDFKATRRDELLAFARGKGQGCGRPRVE